MFSVAGGSDAVHIWYKSCRGRNATFRDFWLSHLEKLCTSSTDLTRQPISSPRHPTNYSQHKRYSNGLVYGSDSSHATGAAESF